MDRCIGEVLAVVIDKLGPLFGIRFKCLEFQLTGAKDTIIEFKFRHNGFTSEECDFALGHFYSLLFVGREIETSAKVFPRAGFGEVDYVYVDVGSVI